MMILFMYSISLGQLDEIHLHVFNNNNFLLSPVSSSRQPLFTLYPFFLLNCSSPSLMSCLFPHYKSFGHLCSKTLLFFRSITIIWNVKKHLPRPRQRTTDRSSFSWRISGYSNISAIYWSINKNTDMQNLLATQQLSIQQCNICKMMGVQSMELCNVG